MMPDWELWKPSLFIQRKPTASATAARTSVHFLTLRACSAELLIKSENRSASTYISLWPLRRGCQQECQLMTAVLDIFWVGTKLRLQIPFMQPTKHPSNSNCFLTLDKIRRIFQWGKFLKWGRLLSMKKKIFFLFEGTSSFYKD